MTGDMSSVGNITQAGDQRNPPQSEIDQPERFEEGKPESHKANDAKDERSIANKLEAAQAQGDDNEGSGKNLSEEDKLAQKDATLPARSHGNEPSKGAKIDQELREEEEEILKKKGPMGPKASQ